jgi:hypothetical protein
MCFRPGRSVCATWLQMAAGGVISPASQAVGLHAARDPSGNRKGWWGWSPIAIGRRSVGGLIGAVSAQDVMAKFGVGRTVGYRRLRALVDHGLLSRVRLVYGQPALYVATRDGLAWAAMPQVDPARVGVVTTRHWRCAPGSP